MDFEAVTAKAAADLLRKLGKPASYQAPGGAVVPCRAVVVRSHANRGPQMGGLLPSRLDGVRPAIAGERTIAEVLVAEVGPYADGAVLICAGVTYRVTGKDYSDGALLRLIVVEKPA